MKRYATFDEYYADQAPKNRSIILALRKFVTREAPQLEESVKWGNGCWVKGKVPVAYVYSAPDHVQFGFFAGARLKDPKSLLRGEGKFVRHIRLSKSKIRLRIAYASHRFTDLLLVLPGPRCVEPVGAYAIFAQFPFGSQS